MLPTFARRFAPALLAALATLPGGLGAQSLSEAELRGRVRTALGEPIPQPSITVATDAGAVLRTMQGSFDGSFTIRGLGPGSYTVRVEALGFSPRVYAGLDLRPGSGVDLQIQLRGAGAPVDTVQAGGLGSPASAGRWFDGRALESLPVESPDLASWAALSTLADDDLGMEGLPGQFTRIVVDGLVVRPVRPPGLRSLGAAGTLLTGRTLSALAVLDDPRTLEAGLGAGGSIHAFSQRAMGSEIAVDGAVSAGGMRSAQTDPDDAPDALSFWGGGLASVMLVPDTASLVIGADAWQVERPRAALLPGSSAGEAGIDEPYLATSRGFSGFARLDRVLDGGGGLWGTVRLGYRPASTDLAGMAWGVEDGGRRVDILGGAGILAAIGRRETLEGRVGFTSSSWESGAEAGADVPWNVGSLTVLDAATGLRAGPGALPFGSTSRLDLDANVTLHLRRGNHQVKVGVQGGFASHDQDWGDTPFGFANVGSGSATGSWNGFIDARGFPGPISATVPRLGVFVEDTWAAGPQFVLDFGARFDSEWLPLENELPFASWTLESGIPAPALAEQVSRGSGFLGFAWTGTTGTRVAGRASYTNDEVDPHLLGEILASQLTGSTQVVGGGFRGWPDVPNQITSPSLVRASASYLRTDVEAPATIRFQGVIGHSTGGTTVEASGVVRRTDGLVRRRDLNRSVAPRGSTSDGRSLWGLPNQEGAWLGADPDALGRFTEYGSIWELDQGGWSEYVGLTGRLETELASGVTGAVEYTWSRTEDNVPGLGSFGQAYGVALEAEEGEDATVGVSDMDRPHRLVASLSLPLPVGEGSLLTGLFRYQSGAPFTPGFAPGVDPNADGVVGNDPAFIDAQTAGAIDGWACLDSGAFAARNSCRTEAVQSLDLRLQVGLPGFGAQLVVDALNVLDREMSLIDSALLRVNPAGGVSSSGSQFTLPLVPNAGFGDPLVDRSPGRLIRVGLRIGR